MYLVSQTSNNNKMTRTVIKHELTYMALCDFCCFSGQQQKPTVSMHLRMMPHGASEFGTLEFDYDTFCDLADASGDANEASEQ